MNVIQKFLLSLLFIASGSNVFSFVGSYFHLEKEGKEIFLLGDVHVAGKINTDESNLLFKYFSSAAEYAQSVVCILESEGKYCQNVLNNACEKGLSSKEMYASLNLISACAVRNYKSNDWMHENLKFVYSEMRTKNLSSFAILKEFGDTSCSFQQYREDLHPWIEKIKLYQLNHSDDLNTANFKQCVEYFNAMTDSQDTQTYVDLLANVINFNFYIDSMSALKIKNKSIVLVGADHAEALCEMYKRQGFKVVDHEAHTKFYYNLFLQETDVPFKFVMSDAFNRSLLTPERVKMMFGCDCVTENVKKIVVKDQKQVVSSATQWWQTAISCGAVVCGTALLSAKNNSSVSAIGVFALIASGVSCILRSKL